MISSEMPEILGLSDRILVLSQGRITGEFEKEEVSQEAILKCAVKTRRQYSYVITMYTKYER